MFKFLNKILRYIFFAVIVRFVVLILIGINVRNRDKIPLRGPAIIIANHNSHLDTVVLMTLFNLKLLPTIHPLAAADYFLSNKLMSWFAREIIGIIPIARTGHKAGVDPLEPCYKALDDKQIVILFPEGTRGEPEKLSTFKKGISFLAQRYPEVPIVPIFIHGLGKTLPKGEYLLVPFFCDIFVGDSVQWDNDRDLYMQTLNTSFEKLALEGHFEPY